MQKTAELYNSFYPYAVMALAFVAALCSIIGGGIASVQIAIQPVANNNNDSCAPNITGAAVMFIFSCIAAMICLWVGGKFSGAF